MYNNAKFYLSFYLSSFVLLANANLVDTHYDSLAKFSKFITNKLNPLAVQKFDETY